MRWPAPAGCLRPRPRPVARSARRSDGNLFRDGHLALGRPSACRRRAGLSRAGRPPARNASSAAPSIVVPTGGHLRSIGFSPSRVEDHRLGKPGRAARWRAGRRPSTPDADHPAAVSEHALVRASKVDPARMSSVAPSATLHRCAHGASFVRARAGFRMFQATSRCRRPLAAALSPLRWRTRVESAAPAAGLGPKTPPGVSSTRPNPPSSGTPCRPWVISVRTPSDATCPAPPPSCSAPRSRASWSPRRVGPHLTFDERGGLEPSVSDNAPRPAFTIVVRALDGDPAARPETAAARTSFRRLQVVRNNTTGPGPPRAALRGDRFGPVAGGGAVPASPKTPVAWPREGDRDTPS